MDQHVRDILQRPSMGVLAASSGGVAALRKEAETDLSGSSFDSRQLQQLLDQPRTVLATKLIKLCPQPFDGTGFSLGAQA
jgi:hypothetical protein